MSSSASRPENPEATIHEFESRYLKNMLEINRSRVEIVQASCRCLEQDLEDRIAEMQIEEEEDDDEDDGDPYLEVLEVWKRTSNGRQVICIEVASRVRGLVKIGTLFPSIPLTNQQQIVYVRSRTASSTARYQLSDALTEKNQTAIVFVVHEPLLRTCFTAILASYGRTEDLVRFGPITSDPLELYDEFQTVVVEGAIEDDLSRWAALCPNVVQLDGDRETIEAVLRAERSPFKNLPFEIAANEEAASTNERLAVIFYTEKPDARLVAIAERFFLDNLRTSAAEKRSQLNRDERLRNLRERAALMVSFDEDLQRYARSVNGESTKDAYARFHGDVLRLELEANSMTPN